MHEAIYDRLRETATLAAKALPQPLFYQQHADAIRQSDDSLLGNSLVRSCRAHLDESQLECAHGICHCEAVARDAGALVLIEGSRRTIDGRVLEDLTIAAIAAGLLHDIKRREENHAFLGSLEADRILTAVGMNGRYKEFVVYAIRNHEAFKQTCDLDDEAGCLVSDALYDADKFRWGPENFTTTLWTIVANNKTPPVRLHAVFQEKMKGIERIKETFRTETGRRFGPEIIDQGITIGNAIYAEMTALLQRGI